MRLARRRDAPVTRGQFRVRVFLATFALFFLVTLVVAAVHG